MTWKLSGTEARLRGSCTQDGVTGDNHARTIER
jgi:hypothetical protein